MIPSERWQETVYLIGGGPSAARVNIEALRGNGLVVAINDSLRLIPWADAVFTVDTSWLTRRRHSLLKHYRGQVIIAVPAAHRSRVNPRPEWDVLELWCGYGMHDDPGIIYQGNNSGSAALLLALSRGAKRIVLIGYDMQPTQPTHWHGGYEWRSRYGQRDYPMWAERMGEAREIADRMGAEVLNANPDSRIRCFEFVDPASLPL